MSSSDNLIKPGTSPTIDLPLQNQKMTSTSRIDLCPRKSKQSLHFMTLLAVSIFSIRIAQPVTSFFWASSLDESASTYASLVRKLVWQVISLRCVITSCWLGRGLIGERWFSMSFIVDAVATLYMQHRRTTKQDQEAPLDTGFVSARSYMRAQIQSLVAAWIWWFDTKTDRIY